MNYTIPRIIETERPATAKFGYALVFDVELDGKAYHLARISEDRELGKWWLVVGDGLMNRATTHASISEAIVAARKTFPATIREHLAAKAELRVRRDGCFRTEACNPELPWLGWVEFARQILEIDSKYRPSITWDDAP